MFHHRRLPRRAWNAQPAESRYPCSCVPAEKPTAWNDLQLDVTKNVFQNLVFLEISTVYARLLLAIGYRREDWCP